MTCMPTPSSCSKRLPTPTIARRRLSPSPRSSNSGDNILPPHVSSWRYYMHCTGNARVKGADDTHQLYRIGFILDASALQSLLYRSGITIFVSRTEIPSTGYHTLGI